MRSSHKLGGAIATLSAIVLSSPLVFSQNHSTSFATNVSDKANGLWVDGVDHAHYSGRGGAIVGFVFNDRNENGRRDFNERGLNKVRVYLDENDNGQRDRDEATTRTNRAGFYSFVGLSEGDYAVRQDVSFGWQNVSGGEGETLPKRVIPRNSDESGDVTVQIIGGDETTIEEYPFMAALMFEVNDPDPDFSGVFQFCGAVLISDRFAATAAHCLVGSTPEDITATKILVGTNDAFVDIGDERLVDVVDITLHPNFIECTDDLPLEEPCDVSAGFDIAVMELGERIDLRESALQSISMVSERTAALANDGVLATTVGWGVSDRDSDLLQDVHVPVADTEACEATYANPDDPFASINFETQICAGAPEGGIDACQGDSGGPLLVRDFKKEKWLVAGFTSYGIGCAEPGFPGVWSRASVLSRWAKNAATEPSRIHRVTVEAGKVGFASFGNITTRFQRKLPIDPRWQLVNAVYGGNTETGYAVDYRIIDEADETRTFNCSADLDGFGPLAPASFPCSRGEGRYAFPTFNDDVVLPVFTAFGSGSDFIRSGTPLVTGTPPEFSIGGALTTEDPFDPDRSQVDPDFPDFPPESHYIDYYDLRGIVDENARIIRVQTDGFLAVAAVYDRDIRESDNTPFASLIDFGLPDVDPSLSEVVLSNLDPDVNYLLGVTTLEQFATGTYTVTVVNGGTAEATTLTPQDLEQARAGVPRTFNRNNTRVRNPYIRPVPLRNALNNR